MAALATLIPAAESIGYLRRSEGLHAAMDAASPATAPPSALDVACHDCGEVGQDRSPILGLNPRRSVTRTQCRSCWRTRWARRSQR
jgi:hypothetical protein